MGSSIFQISLTFKNQTCSMPYSLLTISSLNGQLGLDKLKIKQ